MKPFIVDEIGSGDPSTLLIGGATYDHRHDYNELATKLAGRKLIASNPFHTEKGNRDPDWEEQLIDGYADLCKRYGMEDTAAHSLGDLHAIRLAERADIKNLILLHPPLVKYSTSSREEKLGLPKDSNMRATDMMLASTSKGIKPARYEQMVKSHHELYGPTDDNGNDLVANIIRYDLGPLLKNEMLVQEAIRKVEEVIHAKVLIIVGNYDPWHANILTPKNKTIVRLNQGHFAHIGAPDTVADIINEWRAGRDVSRFNETTYSPDTVEVQEAGMASIGIPVVTNNVDSLPVEEESYGF